MSWYLQAIKNYCNFSGRASRKEYWMFILFNFIFTLVLNVIDWLLGIRVFSSIYLLFVMLPSISVQFRRLHDIDKSAWWLFIALIPIVGGIILFVFSLQQGTIGENKYGSDPKEINNTDNQ